MHSASRGRALLLRARWLCCASACAVALRAGAQERPVRLSLAEAERIADRRFETGQSEMTMRAAKAGERRALGMFLPALGVSATTSASRARVETGQDNFGEPVALESPKSFMGSASAYSVGASALLLDGGARRKNWRSAREAVHAAGLEASAGRLDFRVRVARQYIAVLAAQHRIAVEREQAEEMLALLEATRRREHVVAASPLDVVGVEMMVAERERTLAAARGDLALADLRLRQLLDLPEMAELELTDSLPSPESRALRVDSATVPADHPRVKAAVSRAEAARLQVEAAGASIWPMLSARVGIDRSMSLSSYAAFAVPDPRNQSVSVSVAVTLPVLDQFRRSAATQEAQAVADAAALRASEVREDVAYETKAAQAGLAVRTTDLLLARRFAVLAATRLDGIRSAFSRGVVAYEALREAVLAASRARADVAAAAAAYADAAIIIEAYQAGAAP